jgi:hypothetical protein
MTYKVVVQSRAERDIQLAAHWILGQSGSPTKALRWVREFGSVMSKLPHVSARPSSDEMTVVWGAVCLYVASFILPLGGMSFLAAFGSLMHCVTDPAGCSAVDWLLGLAWVANPAVWAAFIFLFRRSYARAAIAGELAIVLAVCPVGSVGLLPSYFFWVISMALVVYAALRVPKPAADLPVSASTGPAMVMSVKPRRIFYAAVGLPLLLGIILVLLVHWRIYRPGADLPDFDPNENVTTGREAKATILQWAGSLMVAANDGSRLPATADDFWLYDGGNFGGTITYCTFRCSDRADCLKAVEYLGGVREQDLKPWIPSRYAVVMEGPAFYSRTRAPTEKLRSNPWDVRGIKNGLVYEHVRGDQDSMVYCAIDLDRNRVYYVHESGGFPDDEYGPVGAGGWDGTKRKASREEIDQKPGPVAGG